MPVRVLPETFQFVSFDAAYTARIAERVAAMLDMADIDLTIDINESSPLTRIEVDARPDGIVIRLHSGAMEETRRPTTQSEVATTVAIARGLLRARDRLRGGFGDAPEDDDLTLPQVAAWDTYIMGRISRLDIKVVRQAWLYNFRNRHGFSDASDRIFEQVWAAETLGWTELDSLSRRALAASGASSE